MGSNIKNAATMRAKRFFSRVLNKCKLTHRSHTNPSPVQHPDTRTVTVLYANEVFSASSLINTRLPRRCRKWHARLGARIERKRRNVDDTHSYVKRFRHRWETLQWGVDARRAAWAAAGDTVAPAAAAPGDVADARMDADTITHFRFDTRCRYQVTPCTQPGFCGCRRGTFSWRGTFVMDFRTLEGRQDAAEWFEWNYGKKALSRATREWEKGARVWRSRYERYRDNGPWWSEMHRCVSTLLLLWLREPEFRPCSMEVRKLSNEEPRLGQDGCVEQAALAHVTVS